MHMFEKVNKSKTASKITEPSNSALEPFSRRNEEITVLIVHKYSKHPIGVGATNPLIRGLARRIDGIYGVWQAIGRDDGIDWERGKDRDRLCFLAQVESPLSHFLLRSAGSASNFGYGASDK